MLPSILVYCASLYLTLEMISIGTAKRPSKTTPSDATPPRYSYGNRRAHKQQPRMAVYNPPRNGTAAKAVSLDLVLRTLMNSADFHVSNIRLWDSISKMVPGTTPQQCARRWDELLQSNPNSVAGDITGLSATGRPISGHERKPVIKRSRSSSSQLSTERVTESSWSADTLRIDRIDENTVQPSSSTQLRKSFSFQGSSGLWDYPVVETREHELSKGLNRSGSEWQGDDSVQPKQKIKGSFASSFCESVMSKYTTTDNPLASRSSSECSNGSRGLEEVRESEDGKTSESIEGHRAAQDITIKVSDESKKAHKQFYCSRDILLQEMPYFQRYLSEKLADAEISVHCDIKIFEWLINYVKRKAATSLEKRNGRRIKKPIMEPAQSVSILISSYFLKMDALVEESLEFCHSNMTEVLETNGNLTCISQPLLKRLAAKFSPMEVEAVRDKKDKIKSKLFLHQLEQLFIPEYSTSECPSNASTLYLCKFCNQLLTVAQESILPCTTKRLTVDVLGKITYNHERSLMWNVNSYIRSLQQSEALTPRDIYWRLWGIINVLFCDKCHTHFQCWDLKGCRYQPNASNLTGAIETQPECSCSAVSTFAILPQQKDRCCCREHRVLLVDANNASIYPIVTKLRDVICKPPISPCYQQQQQQSPGLTTSPLRKAKSMDTALTGLLQTQQKRSISTNKMNSTTLAGEYLTVSATTDSVPSCGPTSGSKQHQQQQQQISPQDSSELEEDDEIDRKGSHYYATTTTTNKTRKKGHKNHRQKYNSSDWVWNSSKTKVWNQDMQRENDEKRQTALSAQLSQISSVGSASSKSEVQASFAGGIYPRLEAQFRAQHLAKTTMQSKAFLAKKRT